MLTVNRGLSIKAEKGRDLQNTEQATNNDASSALGSENPGNDMMGSGAQEGKRSKKRSANNQQRPGTSTDPKGAKGKKKGINSSQMSSSNQP